MENKPIRVAHIVGKWLGGGVEAVIMNYYRNIDRSKIQFDFLCDNDSTDIPYEEIEKLGGRVILIPPYQKVVEYQKELIKIFKENKYKIVHSHINVLSVFPLRAAKKAGVPVRIAHSHSTTNKKEWKKNLIKQILRPFSKVYATNFMCCSELAGRWLFGDKAYDEGKVYLLNNAIDVEKFKYDEKKREELRNKLNIGKDVFVIGHIGRFVEQKNHLFLVDIFYEVQKKNKNCILILVGQGPLVSVVKDKVRQLKIEDKVIFTGQVTNSFEIYNVFDLFLFPSLYEGLGMVLIEAQANGLNCIASTEVPKISNAGNNVTFINLTDGLLNWKNETIKLIKFNRTNCIENIQSNGFDIKREAKIITSKYNELISKQITRGK